MTRLTRDQAVTRLLDGIQDDTTACTAIRDLLERQFRAALRHRGSELTTLASALMPELDAMESRRRQRVQLVRALFGAEATMDDLFATLPAAQRAPHVAAWNGLERMVLDCKGASTRNGNLMAEQYSTMQRLMHGEDQLYAPR